MPSERCHPKRKFSLLDLSNPPWNQAFRMLQAHNILQVITNILFDTYSEYIFSVALLGDAETGKSSIATRYCEDEFDGDYEPTGSINYKIKKDLQLMTHTMNLNLSDCSGNKRVRGVIYAHYRDADAILVVFDITNYSTFKHVQDWLRIIQKGAHNNPIIIMIGAKSDLAHYRNVPQIEAQEFADREGIKYWETSAKSNENINAMFDDLSKQLFARKQYDFMNRIRQI